MSTPFAATRPSRPARNRDSMGASPTGARRRRAGSVFDSDIRGAAARPSHHRLVMSSSLRQEDLHRRLVTETERDTKRARALALDLDAARLGQRPAAGGWSVAEVYEHLCISNDGYLDRIDAIVRAGDAARSADGAVWSPSLMGGWLTSSLESPRKLPAPKKIRPGPAPRERVVDEFIDRQRRLLGLLDAARGLDWKRVRTSSPIAPIIRLNLGDCFRIMVVHTHRHLGQIERVRTSIGSPVPGAAA